MELVNGIGSIDNFKNIISVYRLFQILIYSTGYRLILFNKILCVWLLRYCIRMNQYITFTLFM